MSKPLWSPTPNDIQRAQISAFIKQLQSQGVEVDDFPSLYRWSVSKPEHFWTAAFDFLDILCTGDRSPALENPGRMPGASWFPNTRLNFARNLLRHRHDSPALKFYGEDRVERTLSYAGLYDRVSELQQLLQSIHIKAGDRVAGFIPNMPEAAIGMLATTSLGAVWSSCSPDFGESGVLDRFGQIKPRVLITADGYFHKGKEISILEKVEAITKALPSLEQVLVVPYLTSDPNVSRIPHAEIFSAATEKFHPQDISFVDLPFDHPVYIMFSSGTTGKPKCIVHGAGGTLLEHKKELILHSDLKQDDIFFYQSTCGWMMWNWHMSGLSIGCPLVLYDGAPFHHDGRILLEIAEKSKISVFGTNAKYISALEKHGVHPAQEFDLSAIRLILSTGSPLVPENFDYIYQSFSTSACLSSISGGTDIIGCFALGCPTLPVYRGELQCRSLGLKVEVWNQDRQPVVGEKGELVCTAPFPSMPVSFWNDAGGDRYHKAYFEKFQGVWHHGDYVELTERGTMIFYGRSDAVLNPGGIRIGTAEIYRQVEKIDAVVESLVIGQSWDDDIRIVLFVRLGEGHSLTEELEQEIRTLVRKNASPFHVPKKIIEVKDIPRTRSGKIVEIAVRKIVHGEEINNTEALANPEALEEFRNRPELRE